MQNAALQQQVGRLQAELLVAQEISPAIRRRSSALLAVSSVSSAPKNEDCFVRYKRERRKKMMKG